MKDISVRQAALGISLLVACGGIGCGENGQQAVNGGAESSAGNSGAAGAVTSGGVVHNGGTTAAAGTVESGGSTDQGGAGGETGVGGSGGVATSADTGGIKDTGGIASSGGTTTSGGSASSGGNTNAGGSKASGGAGGVATNATLTLGNVQTTNSGTYDVVVTNSVGMATSDAAVLTVTPAVPIIVVSPNSLTLASGSTAVFAVTAEGSAPLSYQWRKAGTPLTDGGNVSGAATATVTLTGIAASDAAAYDVVVNNVFGTTTSAPRT